MEPPNNQKDNRQDEDRQANGQDEKPDFGQPLPVEALERLAENPQLHAERALLWWETYASDDWKGALG
jgi:hypothetical protein